MKKITTLIIAFCIIQASVIYAYNGSKYLPDYRDYPVRIAVDGDYLVSSTLPRYLGTQSYIPLRPVANKIGLNLDWNPDTNVTVVSMGDTSISLNPNTFEMISKGNLITGIPFFYTERTMYVSPSFFGLFEEIETSFDYATKTAIINTKNKSKSKLFDLGTKLIDPPSGKSIEYPIQGTISVPQGTKRPIVIILHGSHPVDYGSTTRYDIGFSYILEALSDEGFLAIAPNIALNYSQEFDGRYLNSLTKPILDIQIEELQKAIEGKSDAFGVDLTDKGDLDNVILMGMSRGGLDALEISDSQNFNTIGVLSITPAIYSGRRFDSYAQKDIPISVLLSQLDGDVVDQDGQKIYESLKNNNSRTSTSELVYLNYANHNQYNKAILSQDSVTHWNGANPIPMLADTRQRQFLKKYAVDFAKSVYAKNQTPNQQLNSTYKTTMYGENALLSIYQPDMVNIYDSANPHNAIIKRNSVFTVKNAGTNPDYNNTQGFRLPGSPNSYTVTSIRYFSQGASVTIKTNADFSKYTKMIMNIAPDSTDIANQERDQSFTVELTDSSGKSARFLCKKGTPALKHQKGDFLEDTDENGNPIYEYSTFTPISSIIMPLSSFSSIDLENVTDITIKFNQTQSGSFMLKNIALI